MLKRKFSLLAFMVVFVMMFAGMAMAQTSDIQVVTSQVNAVPDALTAPADVSLTATRLAPASGAAGTLTYTTETATEDITVAADDTSGTPVVGAILSITGGDLTAEALITGATSAGAKTLDTDVAAGVGLTITPITLTLNAAGVALGAANLGTPWTYTVTYTMQ